MARKSGFTPGKQSGGRFGRGFGGDNRGDTGKPGDNQRPAPMSPFKKVPPQGRPNGQTSAPQSPFKKPKGFDPGKQSGGRFGRGMGGANRGERGRPDQLPAQPNPLKARQDALRNKIQRGNF